MTKEEELPIQQKRKPAELCVHEVFQKHCDSDPDALAVSAWDGEISYRDLDTKAAQLAEFLLSYGAGPEDVIPLCFEKSLWTVVAVLGVLKTGAAFVLLDPSYPTPSLRQSCEDVNAPFLLASGACEKKASELSERVVVVDGRTYDKSVIFENDTSNRTLVPATPANVAYVVFTSGTTGKPKGIVITHSAISTMALEEISSIPIRPDFRILHFSSNAFDVSVKEILVSLMAGACICIPTEADRLGNIAGFIDRHRVNCAYLTPSVAKLISPAKVPSLRILALGGERATDADLGLWPSETRLLGMYGPAECSVLSMLNLDMRSGAKANNIGLPLASNAWVVSPDDHNVLLAPGNVGELVIEGPTLARGYLHNDELTAKAFVTPTWLSELRKDDAARVYKTGDLVQQVEDGSFEFLGRKDTQVKIHGQRVELEEVEYNVRKCFPGEPNVIADVISIAGKPSALVAFICTLPAENMTTGSEVKFIVPSNEFQSKLDQAEPTMAERLPRKLIPQIFLCVTAIPLGPTGKADRRQLRTLASALPLEQLAIYSRSKEDEDIIQEPITPREREMQNLWAELLHISPTRVGRSSNWFRLGGDSLLAMKLIGRLRDLNLSIAFEDIYQHPTLAEISEVAKETVQLIATKEPFELLAGDVDTRERTIENAAKAMGVARDAIEDIHPLCTAQKLLAALSQMNLGNYTLFFEGEIIGSIDKHRFCLAWDEVVRANPLLRARLVLLEKEHVIVLLKDASVPIEEPADGQGDFTDDFNIWGLNQPLVRARMIESKFQVLIHHIAYDLYAFVQIFSQLRRVYSGEKLRLRPFSSFVKWEREFSSSTAEFWKKELEGFHGNVFPPLPNPDHRHNAADNRRIELSIPIERGNPDRGSLPARLHLALGLVLSHATGSRDVLFNGVLARRGAPIEGIAEVIGPTVAVLPVRMKLSDDLTLLEMCQRVQVQLVDMSRFEGADLPRIQAIGPDVVAGCKAQTLFVVLPDMLKELDSLFSRHQEHHNWLLHTGLVLVCMLFQDSALIVARYDQKMLSKQQAEELLNQIAWVLSLIEKSSQMGIKDVDFGSMNVT